MKIMAERCNTSMIECQKDGRVGRWLLEWLVMLHQAWQTAVHHNMESTKTASRTTRTTKITAYNQECGLGSWRELARAFNPALAEKHSHYTITQTAIPALSSLNITIDYLMIET